MIKNISTLLYHQANRAGQGTGLGLSMSYDIVSKGHGGKLTVKTIEGQETEFIITLPI